MTNTSRSMKRACAKRAEKINQNDKSINKSLIYLLYYLFIFFSSFF